MTSTGYYLLDHRNPHADHFYRPPRRNPVLAVVLHITAGLEDLDGQDDQSAEKTAAYAASTDRPVSWHLAADSDTWFSLLPSTYTAFHCKGYNSSTVGIEISKANTDWGSAPASWVTRTLENAAAALRSVLAANHIPARRATRAELDRAIAAGGPPVGLIGHADLDPDRRTDPGAGFPWDRFIDLLNQEDDDMTPAEVQAAAEAAVRKVLNEGVGEGFKTWAETNKGLLAAVRKTYNAGNTAQAATKAALDELKKAVADLSSPPASGGGQWELTLTKKETPA